ncbi:MAG: hypothetical protein FJY88_10390 [Candidatus Eisenbacteria bacterium]|nr:hypothetical protein [Candidatus Eisenbacteria bacterium]
MPSTRIASVPELPDLVVYIEALRSRILGQRLEAIRIPSPFVLHSVEPPVEDLIGRAVDRIQRLGKRILIGLEGERSIVIHRRRWSGERSGSHGPTGRLQTLEGGDRRLDRPGDQLVRRARQKIVDLNGEAVLAQENEPVVDHHGVRDEELMDVEPPVAEGPLGHLHIGPPAADDRPISGEGRVRIERSRPVGECRQDHVEPAFMVDIHPYGPRHETIRRREEAVPRAIRRFEERWIDRWPSGRRRESHPQRRVRMGDSDEHGIGPEACLDESRALPSLLRSRGRLTPLL